MQEVADHVEDRAVQHDEAVLDRLVADRLDQEALARRPAGPSSSTSRASRTKRQVARSKTCFFLIDGLNDQSNLSSVLSSRNRPP